MHDVFADESLMRQVQQGVLAQMGLLFERYHGALYSFFVHTTRDRLASQDLVQDVFLRLIRYRQSYQPERPFKPWLYQMARNVLYDHHKRKPPPSDDAMPPLAAPASDPLEQAEQQAQLQRALEHLPAEQRELLVLSHVSDLSYREIAQVYGITVNTARVRVFRALRALRSVYLQHNPADR